MGIRGLKWGQENPNYLTYLQEATHADTKPGYDFHSPFAQDATKLPPGHPEGMYDAMGNIYNGVAKAIRGETPSMGLILIWKKESRNAFH